MGKPIILLNTASVEDIAEAVETVQQRCRVGLTDDAEALAMRVRRDIDRALVVASADQSFLYQLAAKGMWWLGKHLDQSDRTLVELKTPWIEGQDSLIHIYRGKPWTTMNNGHLNLTLKE